MYGYENKVTGEHHVALVMGDIADGKPVLARVHSECLTGDALGSRRCDCGEQYDAETDCQRGQRCSCVYASGRTRHWFNQ